MILVSLQFWKPEVKDLLKLHNQHIDQVMIWLELWYLTGAKVVSLKWQIVSGETGPIAMVQVCVVVKPVAIVQFRVKLKPDSTREIWTVANTIYFRNAPLSFTTPAF